MFTDVILAMPWFSFLMALTAGALIGYALCSPFRVDRGEITADLRELQRQNQRLQGELERQCAVQARVERHAIDHRQDCLQLRSAQEQLVEQIRGAQSSQPEEGPERKALQNQVEMLKVLYQDARTELDRSRLERDALAAEGAATRDELEAARQQLRQTQETVGKIRQQREEVLLDLREAQHERAQVANLLRDARNTSESMALQLAKLRDERADAAEVQEQLETSRAQVGQLRRQCSELHRAYGDLRKAHAMLQRELVHRQLAVEQLRKERDQAAAAAVRQDTIVAAVPLPAGVEFSRDYVPAEPDRVGKVA